MLVLVDTPIWSLALRRRAADLNPREQRLITALRELIQNGRAQLVGPVRQELLSGIRELAQFETVRDALRAFPDEVLAPNDYEQAAHWSNECRRRGVSGSGVDFLICSVAIARGWQIFTSDADFRVYAKTIPIHFHPARV